MTYSEYPGGNDVLTTRASRPWQLAIGALPREDGVTRFRVWAPRVEEVAVLLTDREVPVPLSREGDGYFSGIVPGVTHGDRYWYLLDGITTRPDPASRFQPDGVHGPSQVVAPDRFIWDDDGWRGIPLEEYLIYELHVGTFTPEGTFDGVISRLGYLCELGITAVELMPVAQFPGERNWGYDGTFPFAPQNSYGGPEGLKRLVAACHARGMAVIMDVVYNHLGPEGNYLHGFGPYFTDRYRTPWGDAVNFDGPDSDPVRDYVVANALYWISEYHIDALRLDAIHGIFDFGARHILRDLADAVHRRAEELDRRVHVIAESDLNDVRVITSPVSGGHGLDAQWCDDVHHALRTFLTGDRSGYYMDFGGFAQLLKGFREGFVLSGGYSAYRRRSHGSSSASVPPGRLVVFSQNHDQVGNRMRGERLGEHLSVPQLKLAAATVLLSPYVPLLFMGEEYGETAPFPYFVSHGDPALVEAVRRGRREEFAAFGAQGIPPDPQAVDTFLSARLDPDLRYRDGHGDIFAFYRQLIALRKGLPPSVRLSRENLEIAADDERQLVAFTRTIAGGKLVGILNFSDQAHQLRPPLVHGTLFLELDSEGRHAPGTRVVVDAACPESFPELGPFGVRVYRKE